MLHLIVLDEDWRLVAEQRRLAAIKTLGWEAVTVAVGDFSDPDRLSAQIAENVSRLNFAPRGGRRDHGENSGGGR